MIDGLTAKDIPNEKIIRYLGYENTYADEKTTAVINGLKKKLISVSHFRYVYDKFAVSENKQGIRVVGTNIIMRGKRVRSFLKNLNEIILMAVTLGQEAERFIMYKQKISLLEGTLADAIASAYVEKLCDTLQAELSHKYNINGRISCGYCDFPIETQPHILKALNTQKTVGLYCNENYIMLPRKSVTAVMGVEPWT